MAAPIDTIILPTRPQPDTIAAIFLLRTFGQELYPGILNAVVATDPNATEQDGKLLLDVGGGELDHHNTEKCATELVAEKLGLTENPALKNLIAYARRDDTQGKGTISKDMLDRAFGLSGLIASLNKQYTEDTNKVVQTVLPLIEAHYIAAKEHFIELPKLVEQMTASGDMTSATLQDASQSKVAFVTSDHIGLAGFLRSNLGGNYRVVVQRRTTGHVNILTKQNPKIDLSKTIALLRLQEANLRGVEIKNESSLYMESTHPAVPNWYYDPATNSLLNGGVSHEAIEPTPISWPAMQAIVLNSL